MGIRYYDAALTDKIKEWCQDPNLTILRPDETKELWQKTANVNNDRPIKLPLIALSRESRIEVQSVGKKPLSYDGMLLDSTVKKSISLNAIPIGLTYQLDIYCRYMAEADEYLRNFIFHIINYPKLKIVIMDNNYEINHTATLRMLSTVEDTSNIEQHLVNDQFTRFTLTLTIDDAYLFSVPTKTNVHIDDNNVKLYAKLDEQEYEKQ